MNKMIDLNVYSLDALRMTSYEYWEKCQTEIKVKNNCAEVSFNNVTINSGDEHISAFLRLLIDNQLRIDVIKRTNKIREIIIAQAFAPIENYSEYLEKIIDE